MAHEAQMAKYTALSVVQMTSFGRPISVSAAVFNRSYEKLLVLTSEKSAMVCTVRNGENVSEGDNLAHDLDELSSVSAPLEGRYFVIVGVKADSFVVQSFDFTSDPLMRKCQITLVDDFPDEVLIAWNNARMLAVYVNGVVHVATINNEDGQLSITKTFVCANTTSLAFAPNSVLLCGTAKGVIKGFDKDGKVAQRLPAPQGHDHWAVTYLALNGFTMMICYEKNKRKACYTVDISNEFLEFRALDKIPSLSLLIDGTTVEMFVSGKNLMLGAHSMRKKLPFDSNDVATSFPCDHTAYFLLGNGELHGLDVSIDEKRDAPLVRRALALIQAPVLVDRTTNHCYARVTPSDRTTFADRKLLLTLEVESEYDGVVSVMIPKSKSAQSGNVTMHDSEMREVKHVLVQPLSSAVVHVMCAFLKQKYGDCPRAFDLCVQPPTSHGPATRITARAQRVEVALP